VFTLLRRFTPVNLELVSTFFGALVSEFKHTGSEAFISLRLFLHGLEGLGEFRRVPKNQELRPELVLSTVFAPTPLDREIIDLLVSARPDPFFINRIAMEFMFVHFLKRQLLYKCQM
jgi:hypothetical protein